MGVAVQEQETTISFYRDSEICKAYASDSTVMTRLDKLVSNLNAPHWKTKEEHHSQAEELVGKTYETNKRFISFRASIMSREMTNEQKEAVAERLKERRMRKNALPSENCEE